MSTGPEMQNPSQVGVHRHDAVFYGSDSELVATAVEHLREGAGRNEHLILACTGEHTDRILQEVGDEHEVLVLEHHRTYRSAGSAIEAHTHATQRAVGLGATGLCMVGELPVGASHFPHTWPTWSRYEAVINHIFAALPFSALCAYDTRSTDPSLLSAVRQTHPHTRRGLTRRPSPEYTDPEDLLSRWSDPSHLPIEAMPPLLEVQEIRSLEDARGALARAAAALARLDTVLHPDVAHLPPADPTLVETDEYLATVHELLANALIHGAGAVILKLWVDHDHVVTTVTDQGAGFDDPFRGYSTASTPHRLEARQRPHHGLWCARQGCDELTFRRDSEGFTVRARADLDVRSV